MQSLKFIFLVTFSILLPPQKTRKFHFFNVIFNILYFQCPRQKSLWNHTFDGSGSKWLRSPWSLVGVQIWKVLKNDSRLIILQDSYPMYYCKLGNFTKDIFTLYVQSLLFLGYQFLWILCVKDVRYYV